MASPVVIPESVSLAVHALAKLASCSGKKLKLGELMVRPGSMDHLSKVMQKLARAGMVRSKRGRDGGFELAVAPGDIRLMDIWIALEGTFQSSICPFEHSCSLSSCVFGNVSSRAAEMIADYFTITTLADLVPLFGKHQG